MPRLRLTAHITIQEIRIMNERTDHTSTRAGTDPTRVDLADIVEAVARGIARAWAAPDDVRGHAVMIGGLWFAPPAGEGNPAVPPTRVGVDGPSLSPPRLPREPKP